MDRYQLIIDFHPERRAYTAHQIWREDFPSMVALEKWCNGMLDETVYSASVKDNITGKTIKWLKQPV